MQEADPLEVYSATFDTVAGDWVNVSIPWHEFVGVSKAQVRPDAPPLDPARISSVGMVYSRFDFNDAANPNYKPGAHLHSAVALMLLCCFTGPATCLLYTSPSPRDRQKSRMPSSA